MTSYERFVAALELREPDRVPIYEGFIDPVVVEGICPGGTYHDVIEKLDLDMVRITEGNERRYIDEAKGIFTDKWGVTYRKTAQETGFPIEGPIKSESDLASFTPPDPKDELAYMHVQEALSRFKGKRMVIWRGLDGFAVTLALRGMENYMMDYIDNPRFAHGVMEITNEFTTKCALEAVRRGCDAVVLLDDYADKNGPIMGPAFFREFVLPYLKKTVRAIKDAGAYVIKHTDGNIWTIIDDIVETGIDAINPLEPVAGMDIGEVKKKYGKKVCIVGNIDCGYLLCLGREEDVRETVRQTIRAAAPGGGYIISSSNSLQSSVNPRNYMAMVEEAKSYGRYPLQV
jgi:uroporphyrinogen decarboxylase